MLGGKRKFFLKPLVQWILNKVEAVGLRFVKLRTKKFTRVSLGKGREPLSASVLEKLKIVGEFLIDFNCTLAVTRGSCG